VAAAFQPTPLPSQFPDENEPVLVRERPFVISASTCGLPCAVYLSTGHKLSLIHI
jgi:hypothetical protein